MAQQPVPVTSLTVAANVAATDQVVVVYNANNINSNASVRIISVANLTANLVMYKNTPANSTSNGISGNFMFDNNYFYICTSNNVWKRSSLSSF